MTNLNKFFTCIRMPLHGTCILHMSGRGDNRNYSIPDAVFTEGRKGAIVEMKNYEGTTCLGRSQIDKTYNDMCALKNSMGCRQVSETFFFYSLEARLRIAIYKCID